MSVGVLRIAPDLKNVCATICLLCIRIWPDEQQIGLHTSQNLGRIPPDCAGCATLQSANLALIRQDPAYIFFVQRAARSPSVSALKQNGMPEKEQDFVVIVHICPTSLLIIGLG